MFNRRLNSLITVSCFIACNVSETALSEDYGIEISIQRNRASGTSQHYAIRATFSRDDVSNKLVAPNGKEFDYRNQWVERLTFEELASLAFGGWTAQTATSAAEFRLASFGLDDVASEIPFITSPIPGSEVPRKFTLNWESEARGFADVWNRTNVKSLRIEYPDQCCLANFDVQLLNPGKGSLDLDVFARTRLPDPILLSKFPSNDDTYSIGAGFLSRSARATFIIVPEPSAFLLAVLAPFTLLHRRRFTASAAPPLPVLARV